jgi:hypothetical protein
MQLKTSEEWQKIAEDYIIVLDPDGWDRKNYQYSWHEELIDLPTFYSRTHTSTCQFKINFIALNDIINNLIKEYSI